ncbi:hypothetical protein TthAA11_06770 [Thermus thermophilus]|uniref:Uncharacterized protein n=1 Tax=Thermus thermophilus TaxID=274 RepID=A0AAD1KTA6_THETH|nr:hypothetical protein TthAA11_06770 [Thermus thermophilus]
MLMLIGKILAGYPVRHPPGTTRHFPGKGRGAGFCRVLPGRCRVPHPAGVFIVQDGVFSLFFPRCRVCRVGFPVNDLGQGLEVNGHAPPPECGG